MSGATLSPARILAALYNAAEPRGLGMLHYNPTPMTEELAADILSQRLSNHPDADPYFDYLIGRCMKVKIPRDGDVSRMDGWLYDREYGEGAMERVLAEEAART